MSKASFVPILKPLPHLAQFLHVSAVLLARETKKCHFLFVSFRSVERKMMTLKGKERDDVEESDATFVTL